MAIKIAKVTGMIEKQSRQGKAYTQFDTTIGKLNIFDADKVEALQACLGQYAVIDVVQRGEYLNVQNVPHVASKEQLEANQQSNELEQIKPTIDQATQQINEDNSKVIQTRPPVTERVIHEIIDERPHNWVEVGKAGERMKIYFHEHRDDPVKTQKELKQKLKDYAIAIRSAIYVDMDGQVAEKTEDAN